MTTFSQFISERSEDTIHAPIKRISEQECVDWIWANSPNYIKTVYKNPIFRGSPNTVMGLTDTNETNRTSRDNGNWYTIWIDNNSEWSDFPKRSKSLICSSNPTTAQSYGSLSQIIPADNCRIGICPSDDIWDSFDEIKATPFADLEDFVGDIGEILSKFNSKAIVSQAQRNYSVFVNSLKHINADMLSKYDSFTDLADEMGDRNLYEYILPILDPYDNGFKHTTASNLRSYDLGSNEMWIQGECILIPNNMFDFDLVPDMLAKYPKLVGDERTNRHIELTTK